MTPLLAAYGLGVTIAEHGERRPLAEAAIKAEAAARMERAA